MNRQRGLALSPLLSQAAVTSQHHERRVCEIRRKRPHGGALNLFVFEIFETAAADRAAGMAAHAAGVFLRDGIDPVVRQSEEAVPDKKDLQAEAVSGHA